MHEMTAWRCWGNVCKEIIMILNFRAYDVFSRNAVRKLTRSRAMPLIELGAECDNCACSEVIIM